MTVKELLAKEGMSEKEALRDQAMLVGMSKVSHFEAECRGFEKKYGFAFSEMKSQLEAQNNKEDFAVEDDAIEWDFADTSLKWWRERINEALIAD